MLIEAEWCVGIYQRTPRGILKYVYMHAHPSSSTSTILAARRDGSGGGGGGVRVKNLRFLSSLIDFFSGYIIRSTTSRAADSVETSGCALFLSGNVCTNSCKILRTNAHTIYIYYVHPPKISRIVYCLIRRDGFLQAVSDLQNTHPTLVLPKRLGSEFKIWNLRPLSPPHVRFGTDCK